MTCFAFLVFMDLVGVCVTMMGQIGRVFEIFGFCTQLVLVLRTCHPRVSILVFYTWWVLAWWRRVFEFFFFFFNLLSMILRVKFGDVL